MAMLWVCQDEIKVTERLPLRIPKPTIYFTDARHSSDVSAQNRETINST